MKPPRHHDIIKILIVDDSDFSRKLMSDILLAEGYNLVGVANSAEEGIQIAHSAKPNVIFIDIVMPQVSGLELAKHFQEKNPGEKFIIMMSSLNIESMVIESISNGATDFLQKPFTADDLIHTVEKIEKVLIK